jgi:hypothetical protein
MMDVPKGRKAVSDDCVDGMGDRVQALADLRCHRHVLGVHHPQEVDGGKPVHLIITSVHLLGQRHTDHQAAACSSRENNRPSPRRSPRCPVMRSRRPSPVSRTIDHH